MQTTAEYIADSASIIAASIRTDFEGSDEQAQHDTPLAERIAEASDYLRTHGDDAHHSGYAGVQAATGKKISRAKYEELLADALHAISMED